MSCMFISPFKEMELFKQIAAAIGGSLEDVYNLQDKERKELVTVLGLDHNSNYQQYSPTNYYRTRAMVRREGFEEKEIAVSVSSSVEYGGKPMNSNAACLLMIDILHEVIDDVFKLTSKGSDNLKVNDVNILKVKDCNHLDFEKMITDVSHYEFRSSSKLPSTQVTLSTGLKLITSSPKLGSKLRRKGVRKTTKSHSFLTEDINTSNPEITDECVSLNKKLKELIHNRVAPGCNESQEKSNLGGDYGVLDSIIRTSEFNVLAGQDFPSLRKENSCKGGKSYVQLRAELKNLYEITADIKSRGLSHDGANITCPDWKSILMQPPTRGVICRTQEPFRRSLRVGKMSRLNKDHNFVYGDVYIGSEGEEGDVASASVDVENNEVERHLEEVSETSDKKYVAGLHEKDRKRGRKRKLFDSRSNFMSDSPDPVANENEGDWGLKLNYECRKTRNSLSRTLEQLREDGCLTPKSGGK